MATQKIVKKVKLWNRDTEDYKQVVTGEEVFIKAGGNIVCDRRRAIAIRGHCTGKGNTRSMLDIEPIYEIGEVNEIYIDHKTGQQFPSKEALLKHLGLDPEAVESAKSTIRYVCPVCDDAFSSKDQLIAHMPKCLDKIKTVAAAKK